MGAKIGVHPLVFCLQKFLGQFPAPLPRILVAVSGGPDSVALLRGLHELHADLSIAHLNHQLRGAESDEDQAFVEHLAKELQLPCSIQCIDIAAEAKARKENLEAVAREVRYAWLTRCA